MTNKTSNTSNNGAALLAAAIAAKQSAAQPVNADEKKQREAFAQECAEQIALSAMHAEEAAQSLSQTIITVYASGMTFAEMEARELKGNAFPMLPGRDGTLRPMTLKDIGAYRKIKSRILKAVKANATIEPGMTVTDLKKIGGEKTGAKGKDADADADADETPSAPDAGKPYGPFATSLDVVKLAIALLKKDEKMRAAFALDVRDVARLIANEEAEKKAADEKAKKAQQAAAK